MWKKLRLRRKLVFNDALLKRDRSFWKSRDSVFFTSWHTAMIMWIISQCNCPVFKPCFSTFLTQRNIKCMMKHKYWHFTTLRGISDFKSTRGYNEVETIYNIWQAFLPTMRWQRGVKTKTPPIWHQHRFELQGRNAISVFCFVKRARSYQLCSQKVMFP